MIKETSPASGKTEKVTIYFPSTFLTEPDGKDEIIAYFKDLKQKQIDAAQKVQEARTAAWKENRRQEYERMKAEFGDISND